MLFLFKINNKSWIYYKLYFWGIFQTLCNIAGMTGWKIEHGTNNGVN